MSKLTLKQREEARRTNQWRAFRLKARVSQVRWAKMMGTTVRTVSRWETDAVVPPEMAQILMKLLARRKR